MAGGRDIPALTGLRFIAALSVVLAHAVGLLPQVQPPIGLHDWIRTAAGLLTLVCPRQDGPIKGASSMPAVRSDL
jgi:peptidoglycan/LPS O-acetylase OafA/YrhL